VSSPSNPQSAIRNPQSEEARAYWYGLINYEHRAPVAADLRLEPMRRLLSRLGDPHRDLRIVHVAGTKGKGSTAAMLAAIIGRAGYRTGLFTSPHLCRVEERFQIDGLPISDDELTTLLLDVRDAGVDGLTFFEAATAVGLLHFVRRRVGAAVVEVGLGGRFDSTNVCRPSVAVLTSVSFDHTKQLGNRLESIAFEKAGIVKPGRPCVSGVMAPEARAVIERICTERHAPLRQLDRDFHVAATPGRVTLDDVDWPRIAVTTARRRWPEMAVNLLGEHQTANAAVAVACVEVLREQGWHLPDPAVAAGLADVTWPARMEIVGRRPLVVLDCAHNVASAVAVVDTLRTSFPPGRRLLVFAGSSDKDIAGMFRVMAPHFTHAYLTRYTDNPRSVPPEQLAALWCSAGDTGFTTCATPLEAWHTARAAARTEDLICVTGSVFLAGELRPTLLAGAD
jgi:dihydrofolate synthase/folylpolyglutamate synthase